MIRTFCESSIYSVFHRFLFSFVLIVLSVIFFPLRHISPFNYPLPVLYLCLHNRKEKYRKILFSNQMSINFYLFSDNGGDQEERGGSDVGGAQSHVKRRGAGKNSSFNHSPFRHHRHLSRYLFNDSSTICNRYTATNNFSTNHCSSEKQSRALFDQFIDKIKDNEIFYLIFKLNI